MVNEWLVQVGFHDPQDFERFERILTAQLIEVESGRECPCWVICPKQSPGFEGYSSAGEEAASCNKAYKQIWMIPQPVLQQNAEYSCKLLLEMSGEAPLEIVWTFQAFGPRVYE